MTQFANALDPLAMATALEQQQMEWAGEIAQPPLPFHVQPADRYLDMHRIARCFLGELANEGAPGPLRAWPEKLLTEGFEEVSADFPYVYVASVFEFGDDNVLRLSQPHMDSLPRLFGVTAAELLHPDATIRIRRCDRSDCGNFFVVDYGSNRRGAKPRHCMPEHADTPLERLRKFRKRQRKGNGR